MIRENLSAFEQEHVGVAGRATPIEPRFLHVVLGERAKSVRLDVSLCGANYGRATSVAGVGRLLCFEVNGYLPTLWATRIEA